MSPFRPVPETCVTCNFDFFLFLFLRRTKSFNSFFFSYAQRIPCPGDAFRALARINMESYSVL